jgi:farnesyl-diphosphate farnesyltransferase
MKGENMLEAQPRRDRFDHLQGGVSGMSATFEDLEFQDRILPGVSRTFALTIPQLPGRLRTIVTTAYLLCRIADTIEDDSALNAGEKDRYLRAFLAALEEDDSTAALCAELCARLSPTTLPDERELIRQCTRVIRVAHSFTETEQRALLRCVSTMSRGMGEFERGRGPNGLETLDELQRYCYFVAGVVGEMLTDLFCEHSADIRQRRPLLAPRAVDFGQGLQMTNILKDIWDDLDRGTCWLPRDVFGDRGYDLTTLARGHNGDGPAFAAGMRTLVGVTHGSLRQAVDYTLSIPANEAGIRRFLSWAVVLALMTLRNINARPLFTDGKQVKVTRRSLVATLTVSSAVIRSNVGLRTLFRLAARGLPLGESSETGRESANA